MDRRTFLRSGVAAAGSTALAGCLGLFETETRPTRTPPIVEDRPDGVYVPSHVEGMAMAGRAESGDYAFAVTYSYAHRFWNVNGESTSRTDIDPDDDVHLMTVVWDPETGTVLPETGLSIEIARDGELVSQEAIYPMLSQPMGFHYGANFGLSGDGSYTVTPSVGALPTRRTGSFAGRFTEPTSAEIEFEYSQRRRDEISFEIRDDAGEAGAVDPMSMEMLPDARAPAEADLPGRILGSGESNDAVLVATVLDEPPTGIDDDGQYLAVSARTPYNRMVIPAMGLSARVTRGESMAYGTELRRTLDPDLGYHYGAVVDAVESGDDLTLSADVQPQTARHEGYETAFGGLQGGLPDVTIEVP